MCPNHDVEIAHRLANAFQVGAKLPILPGSVGIPGKDGYAQEKLLDDLLQSGGSWPASYSKAQFAFGHGGNKNASHADPHQAAANRGNVSLDDVAGGICIKHIFAGHQNTSRSCAA